MLKYDVIIIGCGVSGMTSSIYLARAGKKVLIIEKEAIGGQIASSPLVENYPGFSSISGAALVNNIYEQAEALGVEIELEEVISINDEKTKKKVITEDNTYECKSIIIATGVKYRLLNLDNELNLIGNGIHFCVACDGAFYKNKVCAVIGGGNSAIVNAIALSDLCEKVYIIQNMNNLTCEETLKKRLSCKKNVEIICDSKVLKIIGQEELEKIVITSNKELKIDGMFLSIGLVPQNNIFKDIIELNEAGYIKSSDCKTNIDGIFVSGDTRAKRHRQLTTATNDGTIAALEAINYLDECK